MTTRADELHPDVREFLERYESIDARLCPNSRPPTPVG